MSLLLNPEIDPNRMIEQVLQRVEQEAMTSATRKVCGAAISRC
jgi:hypothetical protein